MDLRNRILKSSLKRLELENKELKEREHLVVQRLSVLDTAIEEYKRLGDDTRKVKNDYTRLCHELILLKKKVKNI